MCIAQAATAQAPFLTIDSVNINKVNASVLVHGDMWWNGNLADYATKCFFPNGTRKSIGGFGNAVWMSGYDGAGQLHIAAQTYRQNGNDYWPGPLNSADTLTYAISHDWARIWKVNRSDIQFFQSQAAHTTANTHPMILSWPGRGNTNATGNAGVPLSVATDMAPFIDVNSNGIYEPLLGDYPNIKGDQALWWVFSDNGPAHTETDGKPLGVEIHAMSYAYSRGTMIDNVVYYDYEIVNKSANNYSNFRFALRGDLDIGYYLNDYIGFDSTHRMGIQYNATRDDGVTVGYAPGTYDSAIPMAGVTLVSLPGDAGSSYVPAGSFTYYNNDASIIGNPTVDTHYNNYMRSKLNNGQHFRNDYVGPGIMANGHGAGPDCNYVFTGDPSDNTKWSECASANMPGDRRFILASNDFTLSAGATQHIGMALVVTDTSQTNYCSAASFTNIKTLADTAWNIYHNPLPPKPAAVSDIAKGGLDLYPNPANNILHIGLNKSSSEEQVSVHNPLGQLMEVPVTRTNTEVVLDISRLVPGVYLVHYTSESSNASVTFRKY